MLNNQLYLFVVQLNQPGRFEAIFGEAIAKFAYADLTRDIRRLSDRLLQKYRLYRPITSAYFGRWYALFGLKETLMPFDMLEQIPVLQAVGTAEMHALLLENLGQATGSRQDFRILILPAPENIHPASIDQAIDLALLTPPKVNPVLHGIETQAFLQDLTERDRLECYFQPICSLIDQTIVGYEALTRGPADSALHSADALFTAAHQFGMTQALEFACLKRTFDWLPRIPSHFWISVNLGPGLFMSSLLQQYLANPAITPLLSRVVFELTEHLPIESAVRLHVTLNELRRTQFKLSLDDTGCGFFDMTTVEELRPEIIKLCITVISRIGRKDGVEREISRTIQAITRLGGITLGEGVEHAYQADALKQCGAALAQGHFFGPPQPARDLFPD